MQQGRHNSQVGILSKRPNGWSWFCHGFVAGGGFSRPVIHCVLAKLLYLQNKGTSFWNVVLNSLNWKISRRHVDRRNVSLVRQMWMVGVINYWPSSVELIWQHLRRSTFDRRLCIARPVYHTDRPALCTARCAWGSASRGSVCDSWFLFLHCTERPSCRFRYGSSFLRFQSRVTVCSMTLRCRRIISVVVVRLCAKLNRLPLKLSNDHFSL